MEVLCNLHVKGPEVYGVDECSMGYVLSYSAGPLFWKDMFACFHLYFRPDKQKIWSREFCSVNYIQLHCGCALVWSIHGVQLMDALPVLCTLYIVGSPLHMDVRSILTLDIHHHPP